MHIPQHRENKAKRLIGVSLGTGGRGLAKHVTGIILLPRVGGSLGLLFSGEAPTDLIHLAT